MFCSKFTKHFVVCLGVIYLTVLQASISYAQNDSSPPDIDPQLVQIIEDVKYRASAFQSGELEKSQPLSRKDEYANRRVEAVSQIQLAAFSENTEKIRAAISEFQAINDDRVVPAMGKIVELYTRHADLLDDNASEADQQLGIERFRKSGSWFERYYAIQLSRLLYAQAGERQAALQQAQYAFQLIPKEDTQDPYIRYAKADISSTLVQLHTIQGNVDLAVLNTIEYLRITEGETDPKTEIDLVNNLIFLHALSRDHEALEYLGDQLLEISEFSPSSIVGLPEYRVAQAANMAGNFNKGLKYARLAAEKSEHPGIKLQAKINQAIALSGLNQKSAAISVVEEADVNLDDQHLLNEETRRDVLYLGFLLAAGSDETLARNLYNRQLDVTAQKFLANSSRDTTAMVAELENSRERQLEREAASAREAELQAITIDRQRKLNRVLILLTLALGGLTIGLILFLKSREKLLHKLEIKTVEAGSAEKLKTEFLGMISHELRTPLNGIIGISDFLANYHDDPNIREKTGIVLRSGNELLSVVESLTDMARLDAGQLELLPHTADLSTSLAAVPTPWAEKAQEKGLTFTQFLDPQISEHLVDEDRLIQCLNILLANAISFTDTGRVHLHITANVAAERGVTGLTAIIADTGQGMSELVQSRLFKPFMQADTSRKRSHMGTGLSLAIAYALTDMMGGRLTVNSREGRGSEFKLDIPLSAPAQQSANFAMPVPDETLESNAAQNMQGLEIKAEVEETPAMPAPVKTPDVFGSPVLETPVLDGPHGPQSEVVDLMQPRGDMPSLHNVQELVLPIPPQGPQHILVADDMSSNRDVLRLILESQGHRCREAADGLTALAALDRQAFDLVVLDIHMTPMDGVETLRRIRASGKSYANIPVIALTADNAASTNATCMEVGADLFLTKPVNRDELLRAISYLNQSEGTRILSQ